MIAVSLAAAALLHIAVERPFLELRARLGRPAVEGLPVRAVGAKPKSTAARSGGMKIGVISQVFDGIAPDGFSSVGLVGHHLALELAGDHQVVVYGSGGAASNRGDWPATINDGIDYRIVPPKATDLIVARAWPYATRVGGAVRRGLRPPVSTSGLSGRSYVHAVAADVAREHFDVLHVHHATQYLPALRAAAPDAVILLHAHASGFPRPLAPCSSGA